MVWVRYLERAASGKVRCRLEPASIIQPAEPSTPPRSRTKDMESRTQLNESTIEKVNDLIKANANSADIYGKAVDLSKDDQLKTLFRDLKTQRESQLSELRAQLNQTGVFETAESTLVAPLQSWFMKVRDQIQSDEHVGLLSEPVSYTHLTLPTILPVLLSLLSLLLPNLTQPLTEDKHATLK